MAIILQVPTNLPIGDFNSTDWVPSRNGSAILTPREVVNDFTYGSGQAIKHTVISDGTLSTYRCESSGSGGASSPIGTNRGLTAGMERWFGFSFMIHPDTNINISEFTCVIAQMLQDASATLGQREPNFALEIANGRFQVGQKWDITLDETMLDKEDKYEWVDIGQAMPGFWYRFIFHLILSRTGPATTEVYRSIAGSETARLAYRNLTDPNGYNDSGKNQSFKLGCYIPSWKAIAAAAGSRVSFLHDHIMIGDETSSLAEMMNVSCNPIPKLINYI